MSLSPLRQVLELLQEEQARPPERRFLPTTLGPLDAALHGGVPSASITEVVGPAGLGKTQICLTLTVMALLGTLRESSHAAPAAGAGAQGPEQQQAGLGSSGRVIYVDTEHKMSAPR